MKTTGEVELERYGEYRIIRDGMVPAEYPNGVAVEWPGGRMVFKCREAASQWVGQRLALEDEARLLGQALA